MRKRQGDQLTLTTYGRSSGFVIDPIEKKPLNHFYPGTSVLSFGTAGCNLTCKFCQNWDISKSRDVDKLQSEASPDDIANACLERGCKSIAFTYNDPVIYLEYAVDVARACRAVGLETVAVTAGYITPDARKEFFSQISAANVDLKAFSEAFYQSLASAHLQPVLDTLRYLREETEVWLEITTLLIPGFNDGDEELKRMCAWLLKNLGDQVPLHFSGYHPDFKMTAPKTPPSTLERAWRLARAEGLKHVYMGNVHHLEGDETRCAHCGASVIRRDWYKILSFELENGGCAQCGTPLAGRFEASAGDWGRKRLRVVMG